MVATGSTKKEEPGINPLWASEAKALALLAFRHGPLEDIQVSRHISGPDMMSINKYAVDELYRLIAMKRRNRRAYNRLLDKALRLVDKWDDPDPNHEAKLTAWRESVPDIEKFDEWNRSYKH